MYLDVYARHVCYLKLIKIYFTTSTLWKIKFPEVILYYLVPNFKPKINHIFFTHNIQLRERCR